MLNQYTKIHYTNMHSLYSVISRLSIASSSVGNTTQVQYFKMTLTQRTIKTA